METVIMYLLFALGLVLIIKGGDWFVDGAAWIADASGIPKFIIGATIVSFATTLPEMIVSSIAAAQGKLTMACGNAIGSVTANIALIMAIALIAMPMVIKRKDYIVKSILMLSATAFLLIFSLDGELKLYECAPVLIIFIVFVIENIISAKKSADENSEPRPEVNRKTLTKNIAMLTVGLAGIVGGSQLLVEYGSNIARSLGVGEAVISLTAIAIGTSLPELVTTVSAIIKKLPSLSVGNVIGANIIDMTLILPISSLINGGSIKGEGFVQTARLDLPACLIVGAIALVPALIAGKFRRYQGLLLLLCYGVYLTLIMLAERGALSFLL